MLLLRRRAWYVCYMPIIQPYATHAFHSCTLTPWRNQWRINQASTAVTPRPTMCRKIAPFRITLQKTATPFRTFSSNNEPYITHFLKTLEMNQNLQVWSKSNIKTESCHSFLDNNKKKSEKVGKKSVWGEKKRKKNVLAASASSLLP